MRFSKAVYMNLIPFKGTMPSRYILSTLTSVSLIAFILPLSSCDKSLRISKIQAQSLKYAAEAIRKRKEELTTEIKLLEFQQAPLHKRQTLMFSNLDAAREDTSRAQSTFDSLTKSPKHLQASKRFFADVSASYLEYKPRVSQMTFDNYEEIKVGLFQLFANNIEAINIIVEECTFAYLIVVTSVPKGAKVFYKTALSDFKPWSEDTNTKIHGSDITRAEWIVELKYAGKSQEQQCKYKDVICCLTFNLTE